MKATETKYIIDAGPIIGALSARDQWHDWSRRILALIDEPVATTEIVFGEACHLLKAHRPGLFAAIEGAHTGRFLLFSRWIEHGPHALELLQKYPQMDAGDCSLVILSEVLPRATIITTDTGHFRLYRRFRNQALPLLTPD